MIEFPCKCCDINPPLLPCISIPRQFHTNLLEYAYKGDISNVKRICLQLSSKDILRKDRQGRGALYFAAAGGGEEVLEYLLHKTKPIQSATEDPNIFVREPDNDGRTILMASCFFNRCRNIGIIFKYIFNNINNSILQKWQKIYTSDYPVKSSACLSLIEEYYRLLEESFSAWVGCRDSRNLTAVHFSVRNPNALNQLFKWTEGHSSRIVKTLSQQYDAGNSLYKKYFQHIRLLILDLLNPPPPSPSLLAYSLYAFSTSDSPQSSSTNTTFRVLLANGAVLPKPTPHCLPNPLLPHPPNTSSPKTSPRSTPPIPDIPSVLLPNPSCRWSVCPVWLPGEYSLCLLACDGDGREGVLLASAAAAKFKEPLPDGIAVSQCIEQGISWPSGSGVCGRHPLHLAVMLAAQGYMQMLENILKTPTPWVSCRDISGFTPLHYACKFDCPAALALLLQYSDNNSLCLRSNHSKTVFHICAMANSTRCFQMLIYFLCRKGEGGGAGGDGRSVGGGGSGGETNPEDSGSIENTEYNKNKMSNNATNNDISKNAFLRTPNITSTHILNLLNEKDNEGSTPAICAVRSSSSTSLLWLIRVGCDLHACDMLGRNALHHAVLTSNKEAVCVLCEFDGDSGDLEEARDSRGKRPMDYLQYQHRNATQPPVTIYDADNIWIAARQGDVNMCKRVIHRSGTTRALLELSVRGYLAVHVAAKHGQHDFLHFILHQLHSPIHYDKAVVEGEAEGGDGGVCRGEIGESGREKGEGGQKGDEDKQLFETEKGGGEESAQTTKQARINETEEDTEKGNTADIRSRRKQAMLDMHMKKAESEENGGEEIKTKIYRNRLINGKTQVEHPLILATRGGHFEACRVIIESSPSSLESRTRTLMSSLHIACGRGDVKTVEILLNNYFNNNTVNNNTKSNNHNFGNYCLNDNILSLIDSKGNHALHHAACGNTPNHAEVIKYICEILSAGGREILEKYIKLKNHAGLSPLQASTLHSHTFYAINYFINKYNIK